MRWLWPLGLLVSGLSPMNHPMGRPVPPVATHSWARGAAAPGVKALCS